MLDKVEGVREEEEEEEEKEGRVVNGTSRTHYPKSSI